MHFEQNFIFFQYLYETDTVVRLICTVLSLFQQTSCIFQVNLPVVTHFAQSKTLSLFNYYSTHWMNVGETMGLFCDDSLSTGVFPNHE